MRHFTDPQPAIEWFCTGGSVCIGIEGVEERADVDAVHDRYSRPVTIPNLPVRFPIAAGEA